MHTTLEFGAHITQHNIHMFICLLYVIQQKYMETDRHRSARKKERKKQAKERKRGGKEEGCYDAVAVFYTIVL